MRPNASKVLPHLSGIVLEDAQIPKPRLLDQVRDRIRVKLQYTHGTGLSGMRAKRDLTLQIEQLFTAPRHEYTQTLLHASLFSENTK